MKIIGVIPARMRSTRLPGKPLAKICGRPMIEHVYRRARLSRTLAEVYVATCDREIVEVVHAFGGRAVMTAATHQRGTDRVAEAVENIRSDADVVVNIQGDEPLLHPQAVELVCAPLLEDPTIQACNLTNAFETEEDFRNPNQPKVVCDLRGFALYISREPIPTTRYLGPRVKMLRQLGIYAFARELLRTFSKLPPTPLEEAESVDMLRLLEHGHPLKIAESPYPAIGVDTPEDLAKVEALMRSDPFFDG
jgi:3-deoxy-manno-octulosonate cytidylyltransferase (CMP-KDO synthetase)